MKSIKLASVFAVFCIFSIVGCSTTSTKNEQAATDQAELTSREVDEHLGSASGARKIAATAKNYCDAEIKGMDCSNIPTNRRDELGRHVDGGNPVAVATKGGNLFVYYTVGGADLKKCQVAGNVSDFKLSANPGDVATAYFIISKGKNELWDLRMSGKVSKAVCPKAAKVEMLVHSKLGGSIAKINGKYQYRIAPNSKSNVVGIALTDEGNVLEWTDKTYKKEYKAGKEGFDRIWDSLQ